jgi:hypothetical protein
LAIGAGLPALALIALRADRTSFPAFALLARRAGFAARPRIACGTLLADGPLVSARAHIAAITLFATLRRRALFQSLHPTKQRPQVAFDVPLNRGDHQLSGFRVHARFRSVDRPADARREQQEQFVICDAALA